MTPFNLIPNHPTPDTAPPLCPLLPAPARGTRRPGLTVLVRRLHDLPFAFPEPAAPQRA